MSLGAGPVVFVSRWCVCGLAGPKAYVVPPFRVSVAEEHGLYARRFAYWASSLAGEHMAEQPPRDRRLLRWIQKVVKASRNLRSRA